MTTYEICMTLLTAILTISVTISVISVVIHQRTQIRQLNLLQRTLMNFEKIVFDDNVKIFSELQFMNDSKNIPIPEELKIVRDSCYHRDDW